MKNFFLIIHIFCIHVAFGQNTSEEWFQKAQGEKDLQLAILYYTKAINLGFKNVNNYTTALLNRANAKMKLEDYRGAIEDYNKAIEIDPSSLVAAWSYGYRGQCKMFLKDLRGAIADFDKAIASGLENSFKASSYLYRGGCKFELGDKENGCLDLSKAGEMGSLDAYRLISNYCNE